jgi:hypothetical protein
VGEVHCACGDHQLGLLDHGRGDAERPVQESGAQRHATGAADEEHRRQLIGAHTGGAHGEAGCSDGAVEQRAGQVLQLLAAEDGLQLQDRHVDRGHRGPRQCLLRHPYVVPERAACPPVARSLWGDQPAPAVGGGGAVSGAEVRDDGRVDVEAASVENALLRQHLEPDRRLPHHRGVERAGPKVVDV